MLLGISVVPSSVKSQSHSQSHHLMGLTVMTVNLTVTFLHSTFRDAWDLTILRTLVSTGPMQETQHLILVNFLFAALICFYVICISSLQVPLALWELCQQGIGRRHASGRQGVLGKKCWTLCCFFCLSTLSTLPPPPV